MSAQPAQAAGTTVHLLVVGDTLLDADLDGSVTRLSPDAPVPVVDAGPTRYRPGGAGLAALLAAAHGRTTLITALAPDEEGRRLAAMLAAAGVSVVDLGTGGTTPHKLRVMVSGRSLLRIDRGEAAVLAPDLPPAAARALTEADGVLVADYGHGVAAHPALRRRLAVQARRRPLVWDPHPRGPAPVRGAWLVTPNETEAAGAARGDAGRRGGRAERSHPGHRVHPFGPHAAAQAEELRRRWACRAVAITCGQRGALLWGGAGAPLVVQPAPIRDADPCGAGDCFAAAALAGLCLGRTTSEAVEEAVLAAGRFVAQGGPSGALDWLEPTPADRSEPTPADRSEPTWGDRFEPLFDALQPPPDRSEPTPADRSEPTWGDRFEPLLDALQPPPDHSEPPLPVPAPEAAAATGTGVLGLARAAERVRGTRAGGGVVVATSGCFDLLHPGHVHVLQQARQLGDLLVVLVNSDASVRRLKGPSRPIQPEADRAAVLAALEAVDVVVVFGEDTPAEALGQLRPDLFAKGGDYFGADLPEAAVMAALGGQAVVLPYLAGRSTTRLVAEASRAG